MIVLAVIGGLTVLGIGGCVALLAVGGSELEDRVADEMGLDTEEVSLAEFGRVENGMTLAEVEALFGGPGRLMSSAGGGEYRSEVWSWRGNGSFGSNVTVAFTGGEVTAKAQVGLR